MIRLLKRYFRNGKEKTFRQLSRRLGIRVFEGNAASDRKWIWLQSQSAEEAVMHAYLYEVAHRIRIAGSHEASLEAIRYAAVNDAIPMFRNWFSKGRISREVYEINLETLNKMVSAENQDRKSVV